VKGFVMSESTPRGAGAPRGQRAVWPGVGHVIEIPGRRPGCRASVAALTSGRVARALHEKVRRGDNGQRGDVSCASTETEVAVEHGGQEPDWQTLENGCRHSTQVCYVAGDRPLGDNRETLVITAEVRRIDSMRSMQMKRDAA